MSTFSSLLTIRKGKPPSEAQKSARLSFPNRVRSSSMGLRKPGTPIPAKGKHVVVGVASYASEELDLLDRLEQSLNASGIGQFDVEVFDVLDCRRVTDFEKFIPGIVAVHRTPVIGVISEGKLVDHATGLSDVESTLRRFSVLDH